MAALQGNGLKGKLPPQLSFLSFLQIFSAGNNRLAGGNSVVNSSYHDIDLAFAGVSTLRAITLHGNAFTGTLPLRVFRDNSQLELLLLGANQFRGTLPTTELAALTSLWNLQLPRNNITGSIPTSLAKLNRTLRKWIRFMVCLPSYLYSWLCTCLSLLYVRSCLL
jgi:hypothetical protein